MGNLVKTDKEIQLDLGLVSSLSKVGLLGPLLGPQITWYDMFSDTSRNQDSKSEVRFRVRVMVQELLAFETIKQMGIRKYKQG